MSLERLREEWRLGYQMHFGVLAVAALPTHRKDPELLVTNVARWLAA